MQEVKESVIDGWRSTICGIAILVFLGFTVYRDPSRLKDPGSLVSLASGLYAVFVLKR